MAIIDQCNFITFANNHIEQLTFYTPADLATYNGVWWSDTRDATVSNNYLENCARGFSISGDNTTNVAGAGTQFTCNEFVNCFHAFYLSNPTLLNQGSSTSATDNCCISFIQVVFLMESKLQDHLVALLVGICAHQHLAIVGHNLLLVAIAQK